MKLAANGVLPGNVGLLRVWGIPLAGVWGGLEPLIQAGRVDQGFSSCAWSMDCSEKWVRGCVGGKTTEGIYFRKGMFS